MKQLSTPKLAELFVIRLLEQRGYLIKYVAQRDHIGYDLLLNDKLTVEVKFTTQEKFAFYRDSGNYSQFGSYQKYEKNLDVLIVTQAKRRSLSFWIFPGEYGMRANGRDYFPFPTNEEEKYLENWVVFDELLKRR